MRNLAQDTVLTEADRALLATVKDTVRRFVQSADVVLYGSMARGERRPHSDYDLLVLTDHLLANAEEEAIEDALYDVQLEEGVLIVASFETKDVWARNPLMPLHQEIEKEAVLL